MDLQVKYYIGKYNTTAGTFSWSDLETDFNEDGDRVKYRKCSGLETKGAPKNIYKETYADSDIVRCDYPTEALCRENTEIALDIVIIRGAREQTDTYDDLYGFLTESPSVFWDTQRKRAAVLVPKNATEPVKDTYLGTPYIEIEFKFDNLAGVCPFIDDAMSSDHLGEVEAYAKDVLLTAGLINS